MNSPKTATPVVIPYGRQSIDAADIEAVIEALQSDWLTTGPKVGEFERAFAARIGAKHAVAVCNATAALHLAMLVARISTGDRVVTSANTFLASANCAAYVGATPDFCDIDPVTYNMCPEHLETNWKSDTKAVVAVDYGGQSADMPGIAKVARNRGAIVIEDACHAVGGSFVHENQQWKVGGHPWADMTIFSFHPVKTMTTGEGGMITTDNEAYANKARVLRSHGMIRDIEQTVGLGLPGRDERGPWYHEMQELGFNFRITDFQCALGLSQLSRLDQAIARRREIVAAYNQAFADCENLTTPKLRNNKNRDLTSWHVYTVLMDFVGIGKSRTEVMTELRQLGVGSQVLYIPVHLQPWYRQTFGYSHGKCPHAESYYRRALSLPLFPSMTNSDVSRVITAVMSVIGQQTNIEYMSTPGSNPNQVNSQ